MYQKRRLQNYATNKSINADKKLFKVGESNGKKIAVIGAGPAGIACACEARVLGYDVDIFEAKDKPSGLTVYGIAPYKITNKEVLKEVEYLQNQLGFVIRYNSPINAKDQLKGLEDTYDAIFIGVGLMLMCPVSFWTLLKHKLHDFKYYIKRKMILRSVAK